MKRVWVEIILAVCMVVAASLLLWGSLFASGMVHDQLADQKITFTPADKLNDAEKAIPGMVDNAGQPLESGAQAKVYSEYIKLHLSEVNEGKTYSQTSTESRAKAAEAKKAKEDNAPNAADLEAEAKALDGKVQTLFRGETLRGLLLYAWGWSLVGQIAFWVAIFLYIAAVVLMVVALATRPHHDKSAETASA